MTKEAFILLILLNICHWAADYTHLSRDWMLSAKRLGKPLTPIFLHAMVHTLLFYFVLIFFGKAHSILPFELAMFELSTHFIIDVFKGRLNGWYPSLANPANKFHWYVFGADQFLHQVVIIAITYLLLK